MHVQNAEGGTESEAYAHGICFTRSSSYEGCVAISMLQPYGLGCHILGLCHTACLGTNLIRNHMLQMRSHHTQHLACTGRVRMTAQNPPAANGDLGRD